MQELSILIQAQYPLLYLVTSEEERAEATLAAIARTLRPQRRLFTWTVTHGIVEYGNPRSLTQHNTQSPQPAIQWAMEHKDPAIFVFKDLHDFLDNPEVKRWLRDAVASLKGSHKTLLLMSPVQVIPVELEKDICVVDFPLPDMATLERILNRQLEQLPRGGSLSPETREKLVKAALGLTQEEAEKVTARRW